MKKFFIINKKMKKLNKKLVNFKSKNGYLNISNKISEGI